MTLRSGQLRMWVSRDESGGIHEADFVDPMFMIVSDPYENERGQTLVDILEGGQLYDSMEAAHVDFWSVLADD